MIELLHVANTAICYILHKLLIDVLGSVLIAGNKEKTKQIRPNKHRLETELGRNVQGAHPKHGEHFFYII